MTGVRGICLALGVFCASGAGAATRLTDVNGQLTGATGVTVGGATYDVAFVDGSCIDLFDGCDEAADLAFLTQADAVAAARALLDQVFLDMGSGMEFDSSPALTNGCSIAGDCRALIPYDRSGDTTRVGIAGNDFREDFDFASSSVINAFTDTGNDDLLVYARFTETAHVPLPAAGWLMLGGLGLLWGAARRR